MIGYRTETGVKVTIHDILLAKTRDAGRSSSGIRYDESSDLTCSVVNIADAGGRTEKSSSCHLVPDQVNASRVHLDVPSTAGDPPESSVAVFMVGGQADYVVSTPNGNEGGFYRYRRGHSGNNTSTAMRVSSSINPADIVS